MNRVVISGWLADTPQLQRTPAGIAVTCFRLRVPRYDGSGLADEVPCLARREVARELVTHAREGDRVNLEGKVQVELGREPGYRSVVTLRVCVDSAYLVLPIPPPVATARQALAPEPLPVPQAA